MDKIGLRIKNKRQTAKLKLTELAEKVGVTVSCLSQIEKGKSFPSINTLKHIANELDTTVGELIGENESLLNNPIVRKKERKLVETTENGTELHLMSHHYENKKMETFSIILKKHGDISKIIKDHHGEEFCYVINGKVELQIDNDVYILEKGDTAYYKSNTKHTIKNISNDESEILWVISPPII